MMLFKLSFQNIKKSFKDYAIYFFTLILGVAIFYVFNALESQTVLLNVSSQTKDIIELMMNMMSMVSVFIAFVLGFLIIYASRFLMKRRHKEFGVYMTLGMSKGHISKILLFETICIGIISLIVGLFLGVMASQVMSVFVANMFEADMTKFTFVFSHTALIKTLIYFSIMYLCVMVFNTISVSKCKLIDLLSSSKKSEKVTLRNPFLCMFVFLIGLGSLIFAYYKVTIGVDTMQNAQEIFLPIILGIVSTFLIIWSVSSVMLRIVQSFKKYYFHHLNSFTVRQISSKINTTVISMSVITIMLFVTICVLSSALSIKNSMTYNLKTLAPMDIQIVKRMDLDHKKNLSGNFYSDYMSENDFIDTKLSIVDSLKQANFDSSKYFQDVYDFYTYEIPDVTIETTLGNAYPSMKEKYPYMQFKTLERFVHLSDYNRLAELYHKPTFSLEDHEYILVADYTSVFDIREAGLFENTPIVIDGISYYPKYQECQDGFLEMSSGHINTGLFVLPDSVNLEDYRGENILLANYKALTDEEKEYIESLVDGLSKNAYFTSLKQSKINATTKISIYENSIGLSAMVTFIGLYLGIIFLISSAAILALKEVSESTDNKLRYQMLRKLGCDEKMIRQALFRQIGLFFLFPLLFAMIHSIFGIQFCNYILETFGTEKLLASIVMTACFLVFIYGGYFLLTYYCSRNIIKER